MSSQRTLYGRAALDLFSAVRICRSRGVQRMMPVWRQQGGQAAGWNGSTEGEPGHVGCGQDWGNLEFPVQNFKTSPRSSKKLWRFGKELRSWQFYWWKETNCGLVQGFSSCVPRKSKAPRNLVGHQGGADQRWGGPGILAFLPTSSRKAGRLICLM